MSSSQEKSLESIANNIGWIGVFVFIIMLTTCVQGKPKVTITADQCTGSYGVKK